MLTSCHQMLAPWCDPPACAPRSSPAPHVLEREEEGSSLNMGGEVDEEAASENPGEPNFSADPEPESGDEKAQQSKAQILRREPPTPPLGEQGAETPLGAEEEDGRRGGGRQSLPTRLGAGTAAEAGGQRAGRVGHRGRGAPLPA